jgi:hypothetical protein
MVQAELSKMPDHIYLMDSMPAPRLAGLNDALDLRNINDRAFRQILESCKPQRLLLYHLTVTALEGIRALRTVSDLSLEWATKVTTLSPVFEMTWLERLEIVDFPRLANIEGIETLVNLTRLRLSGGIWKPLRVNSVGPIAALRALTSLALQNIRIADGDITVLAQLRHLTDLVLSNQFERGQVAFLAKHLNPRLQTPLSAYRETGLTCARCGAPRFMFTGRRMPFLCRSCDSNRFEKLTIEFQRLVDAA